MKPFALKRSRPQSITGQVNLSTRILTVVLMLPAVISLVIMLVFAARYHDSVSRMETVAALKPMVGVDVSEQVWSAVAGREAFADCGAYATINGVNATLERLIGTDEQNNRLELVVARRTMDTLKQYVQQIENNLATGVPVVESEATLEEVRDVAALVDSMLEDYITEEIGYAAQTNATLSRVAFISAAAEILLLLGALVMSARTRSSIKHIIHKPIARLEHFAGLMAGGNLQARVPHTDVEELQNLTDRVNLMADRLESLIEQNRREQENLKKSELRTLQAQINPHFLYNTLDAIIWQAEAGHSSQVIDITRSLSDFFRISLSSGKDWIPVSQEMKHLAGYLSIQKIRYRDILTYELDVPEEVYDMYILKLLLQPLVENALYHGIKYKRGGGTITVTGRRDGDRLRFSVRDTGRGMTEDEVAEVTARMRGEKPPVSTPYAGNGSGFGLYNVDQRIRLYYSQEDGLRIESSPEGTVVSFCVPVRDKGEQNG